jgi:hypothetical protein
LEQWGGRPCPPAGAAGIDEIRQTAIAASGGIAGRDALATEVPENAGKSENLISRSFW